MKTDLGKYGLPKDQKEFAVHTGDQEFIEKVDKLAGGETKTAVTGVDGEKSKKVVNPPAQSFSRTSSPDIDESPDEGTIIISPTKCFLLPFYHAIILHVV